MTSKFPISRDPPEGGTFGLRELSPVPNPTKFPISRDPPEGGTGEKSVSNTFTYLMFPISRDPPEGGTLQLLG